ncbi:MAG: hypothetical protein ACREJ3_04675, partial [Polyangiaceae bacterium]
TTGMANAQPTCVSPSTCSFACDVGFNLCGGACISYSTPTNCTACGTACDTTTGTPSCNGSTCSYTCNAGLADCNTTAPDLNGCECAGTGCCGAGCQTSHTSGIATPAKYYDCNADQNSNWTEAQAKSACQSSGGSSCNQSNTCCGILCPILGQFSYAVCGTIGGTSYCWMYGGPDAGKVTSGSNPSCSGGNSWN